MKFSDIFFLMWFILFVLFVYSINDRRSDYKEVAENIQQLCNAQLKCPQTLPGWEPYEREKGVLQKDSMRYTSDHENSNFKKFLLFKNYGPDMHDQAIGGVNIELKYYKFDEMQGGFILEEKEN